MHLALPILRCRCHHVGRSNGGTLLSTALSAVVGQIRVHDVGQVANSEHAAFGLGVRGSAMLHGDDCCKEKGKKQSL